MNWNLGVLQSIFLVISLARAFLRQGEWQYAALCRSFVLLSSHERDEESFSETEWKPTCCLKIWLEAPKKLFSAGCPLSHHQHLDFMSLKGKHKDFLLMPYLAFSYIQILNYSNSHVFLMRIVLKGCWSTGIQCQFCSHACVWESVCPLIQHCWVDNSCKESGPITQDSFSTNTNSLGWSRFMNRKKKLDNRKFECTITTEEKNQFHCLGHKLCFYG